jgi:hypothetical protein
MSLKGFHVFFITIAALFCLATAAMLFLSEEAPAAMKIFAGFCGAAGLALAAYGVWFVRKKAKTLVV